MCAAYTRCSIKKTDLTSICMKPLSFYGSCAIMSGYNQMCMLKYKGYTALTPPDLNASNAYDKKCIV